MLKSNIMKHLVDYLHYFETEAQMSSSYRAEYREPWVGAARETGVKPTFIRPFTFAGPAMPRFITITVLNVTTVKRNFRAYTNT